MTLKLPNSLWADTAEPAPATQPLAGDARADVGIIGAGFTGLRAALTLAQSGTSVVVLDAGDIGWGASGRNGGQVNPIGHESPEVISRRWHSQYGSQFTDRYVDLTLQSADELFQLVKHHNIRCDAEQNGWIRGIHGDAAEPPFRKLFDGWNAAGAGLQLVEQDELYVLSGSRLYRRGWIADRAGSVQPLSYVRGLARAGLNAGAQIYSHSKVTQLEKRAGRWILQTGSGSVSVENVIVATNGYSDQLIPGLRESIVPVVSLQAATQPLTDEEDAVILPGRQSMADTRRVIYYFRKTADRRLVFGSAGTRGEIPGESERKLIFDGLRRVYPQFTRLDVKYIWGGHIAVTQDHLPHIHEPLPGVFAGLGCNGRGVALSTVMGRLLAQRVSGLSPDQLPIPTSQIKAYPFHRFHQTGIKLAVAWKAFQDRRESH